MGLKAQPHMALPNNQSLSLKLGKALSTTAEPPCYLGAPTRTCFRDFQVGFIVKLLSHMFIVLFIK